MSAELNRYPSLSRQRTTPNAAPKKRLNKTAQLILAVVIMAVIGYVAYANFYAVGKNLKPAIAAIKSGDFELAAQLWDEDRAAVPDGRKRKRFDAQITQVIYAKLDQFITQANNPAPLSGEAAALAALGTYFEDAIYTRTLNAVSEVAVNFKNTMLSPDDLNAQLENYKRLGGFVETMTEQKRQELKEVLESRAVIAQADQLAKDNDIIGAAEKYVSISREVDVAGYNYAQQTWGDLQNQFIAQASRQITQAQENYRYADALSLGQRALQILPNNTELKSLLKKAELEYETYSSTLVDYTGPVVHLFTHNLAVYGKKGFATDYGLNLDEDCITPSEFRSILQQLYDNNYILININMLYTTDNPAKPITTLKLPRGKKPLVFSFDDVNYYTKNRGKGMVDKLVIDQDNKICGQTTLPDGTVEYSYDEHIPIMEDFISKHPDFSFQNARATICLTGYDRVFGYYCRLSTPPDGFLKEYESLASREAERAEAKKIANRLHELGWTFASHTFGHANLSTQALSAAQEAATQWRNEVQTLLPVPTTVLVLAYGARRADWNDPCMLMMRNEYGFSLICGVGNTNDILWQKGNYVFMDRRSLDGYTLRNNGETYKHLFNTSVVYDRDARIPDITKPGRFNAAQWKEMMREKGLG